MEYNTFCTKNMKTSAGLFLTDILPHKRRLFNKIIKNKVFEKTSADYVFPELKKSGVDGIELFLPSFAKFTFEDIKELKGLLDSHKMPVLSVHQALRFFSKTRIAEITKLFHIADTVSAKVIVLHVQLAGKQIFDKEYVDTLHSLEKKYGIKIGFENREKHLMPGKKYNWHSDEFALLMEKNKFHITLDTTHLAQAGGDIVEFFKQNKKRIVNIHLSDYKHHVLNSSLRPFRYKHLPLGKGKLPIEAFLKTLRSEKYAGFVTMEIHTDLKGMCDGAKVINKFAKVSTKAS